MFAFSNREPVASRARARRRPLPPDFDRSFTTQGVRFRTAGWRRRLLWHGRSGAAAPHNSCEAERQMSCQVSSSFLSNFVKFFACFCKFFQIFLRRFYGISKSYWVQIWLVDTSPNFLAFGRRFFARRLWRSGALGRGQRTDFPTAIRRLTEN